MRLPRPQRLVRGGHRGLVDAVAGEGLADAALDQLVDAYGLMGDPGGVVDEVQAVQGAERVDGVGLDGVLRADGLGGLVASGAVPGETAARGLSREYRRGDAAGVEQRDEGEQGAREAARAHPVGAVDGLRPGRAEGDGLRVGQRSGLG
ncbi:hypothetical protein [Streptomyces venezuelae]|uniref:hypothetical protein n=1 Tax=Streptomyces venezuelae TaxID=54571 RepID=UPI00364E7975